MNKKTSMVTGIVTCAAIGAGIGATVSMMRAKKPPMRKTVGKAMKAVGSFVEHINL